MRIKEITTGSIVLDIEPSTCLAIASACHAAADHASEAGLLAHTGIFDALRAAFEAYALVGAARCYMTGGEEHFSPQDVRQGYDFLPPTLNGKEVGR